MSLNELSTTKKRGKDKWEVREKPFTSSVPIFGPIIVGIRNAWSSVAAKWYVRPILEQQNAYNRLFAEMIDHFNIQLVENDRENSEIIHDIAELTAMLAKLNRSLQSLEERLSRLEK